MTKSDLIAMLAQRLRLPLADAEMSVTLILDTIANGLADGHRTEIRGFGAFDLSIRHSRVGRNPKTGETVQVPPKMVIRFKVGKELRIKANASASHTKTAA
jgi:integration host factor subunit beta